MRKSKLLPKWQNSKRITYRVLIAATYSTETENAQFLGSFPIIGTLLTNFLAKIEIFLYHHNNGAVTSEV
jgi:hypothetical protein